MINNALVRWVQNRIVWKKNLRLLSKHKHDPLFLSHQEVVYSKAWQVVLNISSVSRGNERYCENLVYISPIYSHFSSGVLPSCRNLCLFHILLSLHFILNTPCEEYRMTNKGTFLYPSKVTGRDCASSLSPTVPCTNLSSAKSGDVQNQYSSWVLGNFKLGKSFHFFFNHIPKFLN